LELKEIMKKLLIVFCIFFLSLNEVQACTKNPALDVNNNASSEIVFATVARSSKNRFSGSTSFTIFSGPQYTSAATVTIKVPFDAILAADFDGNCSVNVAGVQVRSDGNLRWTRQKGSKTESFNFGINGDKPHVANIQTSSEDTLGKADYVVSRACGSSLCWYAKLSTGQDVGPVQFGSTTDLAYLSDIDGDGVFELLTIGLNGSSIRYRSRKFSTDAVTEVSFGQVGDIPLLPINLLGGAEPEYVVARNVSGQLKAFIRESSSSQVEVALGSKDVIPLSLRRNGNDSLAVFSAKTGNFAFKPTSGQSSTVRLFKKTATRFMLRPYDYTVAPNEVLALGTAPSPGDPTNVSCTKFDTWAFGDTWKASDTRTCGEAKSLTRKNYVPGLKNRKGNASMSPPSKYGNVSKIELFSSTGQLIAKGSARAGFPNGRYTVDFCPGPVEIERTYGTNIILRYTYKDGTTECLRIPKPFSTIRNGVTGPGTV
jgi:hypothetical protein